MTSENTVLEDIQFSLELLKKGKIDEAREYLESINHPKAQEFLLQLNDTVIAPKNAPPAKRSSTMSQQRRQELVQKREELRQKQTRKQVPVIDESVSTIFEAWKRNMESALHQEVWWITIAVGLVAAFFFLVISKTTFVLTVIAGIAFAAYLLFGEEVTQLNQANGTVNRFYRFNNWVHYQLKTDAPKKIEYPDDQLALNYPGSISSYYALSIREEREVAATIIRSAIASLWARGFIEVHEIGVHRNIFDTPIEGNAPVYTLSLAPSVSPGGVEGAVEKHVLKMLKIHNSTKVQVMLTRPWLKGSTPYELAYQFMGATHYEASQRVIRMVHNDPILSRYGSFGKGRGTRFTINDEHDDVMRQEGLTVLRLTTGITPEIRAFTAALNEGVRKAVHQRTASKNN